MQEKHDLIKKTGLLIVSTIFILFVIEIALRINEDQHYYIHPPNMKRIFRPSAMYFPGIYGESRYTTSSFGLRGLEPRGEHIKILAIGGSTTECVYLDDTEAWPYLLGERLKVYYGNNGMVWVGNAAKSGATVIMNELQLRHGLSQVKGIKYIIALCGINDLNAWVSGKEQDKNMLDNAYWLFYHNPVSFYSGTIRSSILDIFTKTILAQKLKSLYYMSKGAIQDSTGSWMVKYRADRAKSVKINMQGKLKQISSELDNYKKRLKDLHETARQNKAIIIFLTQPALWRANLTQEEEGLLMFGSLDKKGTYFANTKELFKALTMFNSALRDYCESNNIPCIDLARDMRDEKDIFYDDFHFNEKGSRIAADILSRRLKDIIK